MHPDICVSPISVTHLHLFAQVVYSVRSVSVSLAASRRSLDRRRRRGTCPVEHDHLHHILHPRYFAATVLLALRELRVGMDRRVLHQGGRV